MLKPALLAQAVAVALILPGVSYAEFEVSGEAKIEYSVFQSDGQVTGSNIPHKAGEPMKTEPSIKLFLNSDIGEESAFHAELLFADDLDAASDRLDGGEHNSQYEVVREFYFDTSLLGLDFRLGKQQVVWGTADGIKLLDILNPTDFRELNQNTSEDSRIPVWMINAEKNFDDGNSIQFIVSEAQSNFIAGLDEDGDSSAPFIFKGVDSITGKINGFLNIAPALSKVANSFGLAAAGGFFDADNDNAAADADDQIPVGLNAFTGLTVSGFAGNFQPLNDQGQFVTDFVSYVANTGSVPGAAADGGQFLSGIVNDPGGTSGGALPASNANTGGTNLLDTTSTTTFLPNTADSAFEYLPNTTFATFNTFAGSFVPGESGFDTRYVVDDDDSDGNLAFRYKATTDGGVNFSVNYLYHEDANPSVNMEWRDSETQEVLTVQRATSFAPPSPFAGLPDPSTNVSEANVPDSFAVLDQGVAGVPDTAGDGQAIGTVNVLLHNAAGEYYGLSDLDGAGPTVMSANRPDLVFVETRERVNSVGGSFDMSLDGFSIPTILRGEFLFSADVHVPVVDKRLLAIGDLANGLKTEETDIFKYVLGIDFTVVTNLLISTQLIQFYNLDYVEESRTCTTQDLTLLGGNAGIDFDCSKYTGDPSTLHLSNGLNKGDEIETFISFFLSKPFGSDVQHRWNNIIIAENDGGYWNRFDVEYSFNDEVIGTVELNNYWGDEDTTFGQFEDSSNLQIGLKVIF